MRRILNSIANLGFRGFRSTMEVLGFSDDTINAFIYNPIFYRDCIRRSSPTAGIVAEILIREFQPKTVIDIACGCGIYVKEFRDRGVDAVGLDGSKVAIKMSLAGDKLGFVNFCRGFSPIREKADLCVSIECAEHVDKRFSTDIVSMLASASDHIFFTAAIPGQGGVEHINEQPNSFWIDLFARQGFAFDRELTERLRREMQEKKVIWWIPQNLMIFKKSV